MEFKVIGSSSAGNCYILSDGESQIMIECGIPWKRVQMALDYNTRGIKACLCSHEHGDHAGHVKSVMNAAITVYAPFDGPNHHRYRKISENEPFIVGNPFRPPWQIRAFPCVHDVPTVGFLIARGPWKCLYLSDSMYSPYRFGPGLTHIFLEVNYSKATLAPDLDPVVKKRLLRSHMSLETARELLRSNDLSAVREIWLLHLSAGNSNAELFQREIQAATGLPVFIAEA